MIIIKARGLSKKYGQPPCIRVPDRDHQAFMQFSEASFNFSDSLVASRQVCLSAPVSLIINEQRKQL